MPNAWFINPPAGVKDLNALWHSTGFDKEACRAKISALMASAIPAAELAAEADRQSAAERETIIAELRAKAEHLLDDPDLLAHIAGVIRAGGYRGDTTAPMLAYLSITSRLLARPLNLSFIAPSGAGKNAAIDAAIALMPPSAYVMVKAASQRALIYSTESFRHRTVIVAEVDSIPQDDGPAASAIRSLAEDNEMSYQVVVEFTTQTINHPGPTGLMTTSTVPLGEQLSTRMLTVSINDTPAQTREVLKAHAATALGIRSGVDASALVAMQRWLAAAGDHEVVVPFAAALAEIVPVDHVRMRRDFRQLMMVIEAVALLHQRQRERDSEGRVVSTLVDYGLARELILPSFTTAASAGLTAELRQTVDALRNLHDQSDQPVMVKALGDALGIARDTAWHRVKRCRSLGYIVNLETMKGLPAKLVPGDPLPEDRPPLPTVEELEVYMLGDMSGVLAENSSTIQPAAEEEPDSDSNEPPEAVECTVEPAVQTPIQPVEETVLDTELAAEGPAVERLNDFSEEVRTYDAPTHGNGAEPGAKEPCRGGCGKPMPPGQTCMDCAIRVVTESTDSLIHPGTCPGGCGRQTPYGMICVRCAGRTKKGERYAPTRI